MVAAVKSDDDYHHQVNHPTATLKTVDDIIPMDNEMIQFLVSIENSQDFYSNIVNRWVTELNKYPNNNWSIPFCL